MIKFSDDSNDVLTDIVALDGISVVGRCVVQKESGIMSIFTGQLPAGTYALIFSNGRRLHVIRFSKV